MDAVVEADQDLCVSCGICCGGALFDQAKVTPEEEPVMRDLGFDIVKRDGHSVFLLPCGNLCGTACQVYEARPATCRDHRCATLRAMDSREIDRAEADRRIAVTKAAVARVRTHMLPGETFLELRVRFGDDPAPSPDFVLTMVTYDLMMDRYFRRPHQRLLNAA